MVTCCGKNKHFILLAANQPCKNLFSSAWGKPQARSVVPRKQKILGFGKRAYPLLLLGGGESQDAFPSPGDNTLSQVLP